MQYCPYGRRRRKKFKSTAPSDIDIYESRTSLRFWEGAGVCPGLPDKETPEAQVAELSLFDFFRYVRYHGGRKGSCSLVLVELKLNQQCVLVRLCEYGVCCVM